ncbi:hypothetical protein FA13DRAFT_1857299 [Coprinellus micaceus]|uniref:Uncharacterized protein n=1 Tax=Coprinellus micaceus TaxID=71717 RepID=A0A4Y7T914_COPMI|nr:hypothetical protein FA13DRAFT_1857299 [Coprinellus micaceus]
MSKRERPPRSDGRHSEQWTPPPAPAMSPIQRPLEGSIINDRSTHPESAPRPKNVMKDYRLDVPSPLSHVSSARGRAEMRGLDFVAPVAVKDLVGGGWDEIVFKQGPHVADKTQVLSKKEQRVVTRLIERGPKVLFVSLNKEDADEFYKAWANTIEEYELVDTELSIIQTTQRWYHVAAQGFQGYPPSTPHLGPNANDVTGAFSDGRNEEPKGRSDPNSPYPANKINGSVDVTSTKSQPTGNSPSQDLGEPLPEFNDPQCNSASRESHPSLPAPGDDHQVNNSGNRPSTGHTMTRLRFVAGVIALSTISAALGGLVAWTILAYEPSNMTFDIRFFLVPFKLGVIWLFSQVARRTFLLARGLGAVVGYTKSTCQALCSSCTCYLLRSFELALEVMIRWLNQLHGESIHSRPLEISLTSILILPQTES